MDFSTLGGTGCCRRGNRFEPSPRMAAVIPRPGACRLDTSVKRDTTVTKQDDNNKVLASGPEELASALGKR